jgi:hypothetical protein
MVGLEDIVGLAGSREDEMKLLLAHNPIVLRRAARADVDLVLVVTLMEDKSHYALGQVSPATGKRFLKVLGVLAMRIYVNQAWALSSYPSATDVLLNFTARIGAISRPLSKQARPRIHHLANIPFNVLSDYYCPQPANRLSDGTDPVFVSLVFIRVVSAWWFLSLLETDRLDGLLARRFDQKSQLGTILDQSPTR